MDADIVGTLPRTPSHESSGDPTSDGFTSDNGLYWNPTLLGLLYLRLPLLLPLLCLAGLSWWVFLHLPAGWHIDKESSESVVLVGGEKGGLGVMLPYQGNNRDLHNPGDTILDDLSATLL